MPVFDQLNLKPAPGLNISAIAMRLLMLVLLTLPQFGCNVGARTMALFGGDLNIQVSLNEDANGNQPIAVDLVIVHDEELLKELMGLSANEWFDKRDQYKRDYPKGAGFDSWEWEWTPGQDVADLVLPLKVKAEAGLVFARYFSKGDHRARFDPLQNILIEFKEKEFQVIVIQGT